MRSAPLSPQMTIALPVLGAASILIAWQFLLPLLGVPAYIVPTPTAIFGVFQKNFALLRGDSAEKSQCLALKARC